MPTPHRIQNPVPNVLDVEDLKREEEDREEESYCEQCHEVDRGVRWACPVHG